MELSAELNRLYDFDSQVLQPALADLRRADSNFFERRGRVPQVQEQVP